MKNLINLFNRTKLDQIKFLLSYKISQDHLEVYFSAIRSRGGFNNNPNTIQFWSAYKRLLVRHQINGSLYGNCSIIDTCSILFVGANSRKNADAICDENDTINTEDDNIIFPKNDHDYDYRIPALDDYVVDIVKYTSDIVIDVIPDTAFTEVPENALICVEQ